MEINAFIIRLSLRLSEGKMGNEKSKYKIKSGLDAINNDVPDIPYIVEQKIRKQAKFSIIGKWKTAKSFLTLQAGLSIAAGKEFLGFKTTASNVLYLNHEISDEMFQTRIKDMNHVLGYDVSRFKYLTITNLSLDIDSQELETILNLSISEGFPVEVLIIDPRYKAIKQDSNQDAVVNAFCTNLDKIIEKFKITVIIVHHSGTNTTSDKAGKGSTVFDAWLDAWIKIYPQQGNEKKRDLDTWARDSEREVIPVEFDYPIHKIAPYLLDAKKLKTDITKKCIIDFIHNGDKSEQETRYYVLGLGHTDYSFWRAKKELVEDKKLRILKGPGPGNRKILSIFKEEYQSDPEKMI